jgi:hypothetical protein
LFLYEFEKAICTLSKIFPQVPEIRQSKPAPVLGETGLVVWYLSVFKIEGAGRTKGEKKNDGTHTEKNISIYTFIFIDR